MTHELLWSEKERLLDPKLCDDEVDSLIDTLVKTDLNNDSDSLPTHKSNDLRCFMDKIGNLNLWISSRKAGRPPACWEYFDAILNVTDVEYPTMTDSIKDEQQSSTTHFYLMLPVAEGKKDKSELERWMPVGLHFLIHHLQHRRRVLVHCAQGKDRSVAVVLALVSLVCPLKYPLSLRRDFYHLELSCLERLAYKSADEDKIYLHSGLSAIVVDILLKEDDGRDLFLKWAHQYSESHGPLANKHTLRIGEF